LNDFVPIALPLFFIKHILSNQILQLIKDENARKYQVQNNYIEDSIVLVSRKNRKKEQNFQNNERV